MANFNVPISQFLILACALSLLRCCYFLFFHPLSAYPGPLLARITNLWRFLDYFQGSQHITDQKLHKRYGPIVRIGPDSLLFGDVAAYQAIYGFNAKIEKGDFYLMSGDPDPKKRVVFQARSEEEHRRLRSRLAPIALSPKHVAEYEGSLSNNVRLFIEKLGEEQEKAESVIDISKIVKRLTADAIIDLVWGSPQGSLAAGYDKNGTIQAKEKVTQTAFGIALLPWVNRNLSIGPIFRYTTQRPRFDSNGNPTELTALFVHLKKCFAELSDPNKPSTHASILAHLLNVEADSKRKITDPEHIFRECTNFTFAGPGSTAAAITCAIYDLGLYPYWQRRIRADLSTVAPFPASNPSLLWKLPSLQAFLRESWRLSPPFLGVFERVISKGAEMIIPGVKAPLPTGTRIGSDLYVVMRSKEVFGEDAERFRPERWLEEDEAHRKVIEDGWVVFGRGSRGCIGQNIALMLACKTIAEVLSKWTIKSTPDGLKGRNNFERHYEQALVTLKPIV